MMARAAAIERGIKYFLISYTDLFGTQRAKLVPAAAIKGMARSGAGFAGFATWLDMTTADPDLFAVPDPDSLIQLPWKPEVSWLAADLWMDGKLVEQSPRNVLKKLIAEAAKQKMELKSGVECEFFLVAPSGDAISDDADRQSKPCYAHQRAGSGSPIPAASSCGFRTDRPIRICCKPASWRPVSMASRMSAIPESISTSTCIPTGIR